MPTMNRRQVFMVAATMLPWTGIATASRAVEAATYKLPYERISPVPADSLSSDGRFASMPLRFRPDNEIAVVSFDEQIEHRLVFAEWTHVVDTALNHDGSRLAVVCRKNYVESTILIMDMSTYGVIETLSTPFDIYQRPVYWDDSLYYVRSIEADTSKIMARYPGLGQTESNRHRLWRHRNGTSKLYVETEFLKPSAFDLIGKDTFIYRCDFQASVFHKPNLVRHTAVDSRQVYVMDAFAPIQIVAVIEEDVFLNGSTGLIRLKAPLTKVLDLFESMPDIGTSSMNLRNTTQFEVRLKAETETLRIDSGFEYNNFHRFNGTDFLVRTPNNGGKSQIMVVTPEGIIRRKMQIDTLSDTNARYHKIESA